MSSRLLKFVLIVAALLLFTACEKVTLTPIPTPFATEPPAPEVITCPPEYLAAPVLTGPAPEALVDSLTPSLTWSFPDVPYPDASSLTLCIPEQYKVDVLRGPFFKDNLGTTLTGEVTSFTPTLLPGQQYLWGVTGLSGGTLGPPPAYRLLYTGAACEPSAFLAPELLSPANHATVSTLEPTLYWENLADCVPANYFLDLSADPTFVTGNLGGTLPSSDPSSRPSEILADCTRYYWRVAARSADGSVIGPVSDTFTFRTNTGSCDPDPEVVQNGISGHVWHDLCNVPVGSPAPDPLPPGCVSSGSGGAKADGIRTTGEPGLADVMVRLGAGTCPGTGMGITFTNADGFYYFEDVPAGEYCISVDAADSSSILTDGSWTSPDSSGSLAYGPLSVPAVEAYFYNVDFGWDFNDGTLVEYTQYNGTVFDDVCGHTMSTNASYATEGCVMGTDGFISANGTMDSGEAGIENVQAILYQGTCTSPSRRWLGATRTDANGEFHFLLPKPDEINNYCIGLYGNSRTNSTTLMPGLWTVPRTMTPDAEIDVAVSSTSPLTGSMGWDRRFVILPIADLLPFFEVNIEDFCYEGPGLNFKAITRLPLGNIFSITAIDPPGRWLQVDPNQPNNPTPNCIIDPDPPGRIAIDDDIAWGDNAIDDDIAWLVMIDDDIAWSLLSKDIGVTRTPDILKVCEVIDPEPPHSIQLPRCWVSILRGNVTGDLLSLPRLTGPIIITPTPTVTPTTPPQQQPPSCSDFTDQTTCNNHANDMQCYWNTYLKPPQCVKQ